MTASDGAAERVKIGILGLNRGSWFARAAAHAAGVELVALCTRDPARVEKAVASYPGTRGYTSFEEMLAADLDAVVISTAPALHTPQAVQALRAGKHVLSEVPAASSFDQCWELLAAVRESGCQYMLAENFCYMRPWSLVKALVQAGVFGELYYGEGDLLVQIRFEPPPSTRWSTNEWAMRQGHPYITHYWGPIYQALGERITAVECLGSGQHTFPWAKADDTSVVIGNTVSGKLVRLRVNFFGPHPATGYIGLQGTQAACEIYSTGTDADQRIYVAEKSTRDKWQSLWDYAEHLPAVWEKYPPEVLARTYDSGLPLLMEEFAQCILQGTPAPIGIVDALNISAPSLASEVSRAKNGAAVEVPDFAA